MVAEHYTLLLRSASYYVDSLTRDRVLEARRLGGRFVSFQTAIECRCCSRKHTVTIAPHELLGFIAHDLETTALEQTNVIPFPVAN